MLPKEFALSPETLQRFVPFDELTPEARAQLVPQAEILQIPSSQQVSEAILDSRFTLYLLDGELMLMAGDRLVDALRGGSPISRFPLSRLRSGQLSARTNTAVQLLRIRRDLVSQLLDAEVHPENPHHLSSSTMGADSVNPSRTLAVMEAVTSPSARNPAEQEQLSTELAGAEAEVESALQDKAEATIARRLWASGFHGLETPADKTESASLESQMARLLSNQARLEKRSHDASEALARAERKKLELEAALRSVEANHVQERAKAEAIGEQLRHKAEAQVRSEEQQLGDQYTQASRKLAQLDEARQAAARRLEAQRKQLEEKFATVRSRLQREVADLQAALGIARQETAERTDAIGSAQAVAQERVRIEVEKRLRQDRIRLESELQQSQLALRVAQQELAAARISRQAAEHEAQQLAGWLQEKKGAAKDAIGAFTAPLATTTDKASEGTDTIKSPHQKIEESVPGSQRDIRAQGKSITAECIKDAAHSTTEEKLHAELEAIERKLACTDSRVTAAAKAKEKASQAKCQVEEQVARHRTVEDEVRLEIYEETEERLRVERQRSEEEAAASIALVEAMRGRNFAPAGGSGVDTNKVMIVDIQQQLMQGAAPPSATQAMQDNLEAERRAAMARAAQEKATAERLKAKRDLQRAREHLIELRAKMQKAPSSSSE